VPLEDIKSQTAKSLISSVNKWI